MTTPPNYPEEAPVAFIPIAPPPPAQPPTAAPTNGLAVGLNLPNRHLRVHGWSVEVKEFTRRQIKGLNEDELFDFVCDELVVGITDQSGQPWSIDDLVYAETQAIVVAVLEYDPKRLRGLRR